MPPRTGSAIPDSPPVQVRKLQIVGNTQFPTEVLHALVADQEGRPLTLPQINALADRITGYYREHGYPLARAVIPAQSIKDGVVLIQVVEARYGQVLLDNKSRVRDGLLQSTLTPLRSGEVINDDTLNRSLLLLSDIPGVGVAATLKPGSDVGTSDIAITASEIPTTLATVSVDNHGNTYLGRARASANLSVINPLRLGDVLSATVLTNGNSMKYGRLSYEFLLNGQGTRMGGAYSSLRYRLGNEIAALGANGTAGAGSLWIKQPMLRSHMANIYAQLQVDQKRLRDHVDTTGIRNDRDLTNWIVSFNGDRRDAWLNGGINVWSLGWTRGRLGFDDVNAAAADAATGQTRGGFSKWNLNLSRLQGLTAGTTLYASVAAQWADGNLDSAEKMTIGGPYSVRAYDVGALSGDTGYAGTLELRHALGESFDGRWQATVFFDSARVKVNRRPWGPGRDGATLSGAGVGLLWMGSDQWQVSASLATRVGSRSSLVAPQASARAWLTVSKAF